MGKAVVSKSKNVESNNSNICIVFWYEKSILGKNLENAYLRKAVVARRTRGQVEWRNKENTGFCLSLLALLDFKTLCSYYINEKKENINLV